MKTTIEAIQLLEGEGYDLTSVRAAYALRSRVSRERTAPSEHDRMYMVPVVAPAILDHLCVPHLTADLAWGGYSYRLTPGQRKWFREVHGIDGLAPTITLLWVQTWEGTRHPRAFRFVSDRHVASGVTKLVTTGTVGEAGRFFYESAQFDTEIATARAGDGDADASTAKPRGRRGKGTTTPKGSSLADLLADLDREVAGR